MANRSTSPLRRHCLSPDNFERLRLLVTSVLLIGAHVIVPTTAWTIQTTVGGRPVDLDARLNLREVIEEDRATKHERTREQLHVRFGISLTSWLRFDSNTVAANGGPTMKANRGGIFNWDKVFQNLSPSIDFEQAYLALSLPSIDIRLGKQKVAWGKLDSAQPNDLINPLTYVDPFLDEEIERKIGVPALQVSYYLPQAAMIPAESRLTAVWVPKYLPYRFPTADCDVRGGTAHCDVERWFPPAAVPPSQFAVPAGLVTLPNGTPSPSFAVPLRFDVHNTTTPAWRLRNSEIGLRYSALINDLDVDLYYFHGFDPQPAFDLTAHVSGVPDASSPLGIGHLSVATILSPRFFHIDAWGAAFAYAFDRISVRGEGAFVSGRPFPRDLRGLVANPERLAGEIRSAVDALEQGAGQASVALPDAAIARSAVEWGLGADYVYDGYTLLLEMRQTDVLNNHAKLLIKDVETRLVANLRKSLFADRVQTQLLAVHGFESDYTSVRPTLLYRVTDYVSAKVGYLFIAGRAASLIGQYRRNDQGFVQLEYSL